MKETFAEYLMGRCVEDTHALDDDLPDVYVDWVSEQDIEDIIEWADKWHEEQVSIMCWHDWGYVIKQSEDGNRIEYYPMNMSPLYEVKRNSYYKCQYFDPKSPKDDELGYVHSIVGYLFRKVRRK